MLGRYIESKRAPWTVTNSPSNSTTSLRKNACSTPMYSRIDASGRSSGAPSIDAIGSHQAPMPSTTRPGATSSSVLNVTAISPTLRVLLLTTPVPMRTRLVRLARTAAGTMPSRARRPSATHTQSKPCSSANTAWSIVCSSDSRSPT